MALRVNKKRQFLFVSKLIAKHLAVHPSIALGTGTLLASLLMENSGLPPHPQVKKIVRLIETGMADQETTLASLAYKSELPKKTVFIGMAETATGLGHSVFQHFEKAAYIHTTREEIVGIVPSFVFEEEHSHATSHKVFAPEGMLENAETIVLIDDELSTGNTLFNLVSALDDQFPGKNYKSLSILDWRSEEQKKKLVHLEEQRNIQIDVLSLMSGEFELIRSAAPEEAELSELTGESRVKMSQLADLEVIPHQSASGQRYHPLTGRFGLSSEEHEEIGRWAQQAANSVKDSGKIKRPLVIGIGENMYLPLRFGLSVHENALVQTTTRSPIYAAKAEGYPIAEKVKFKLPDAIGVDQFLYNLNDQDVDHIYLLSESVVDPADWQPLIAYLEKKAPVEWISMTAAKGERE
ncbi:phosphoribosyltransferase domain-containing protein [Planococcus sp. YIM B11945]|uniref:phosphoribosyltransferase domain-containing protein n=1 Tax=Planococcus sp. YIM B11945 TaxID=3435410 RepID=UPI003D7CF857